MGYLTARTIYKGVFLPHVTYAVEVWSTGTSLVKSQKSLLSAQRAPLLAMTGAYYTVSTNCLPAVAGTLPLDLKVRLYAFKRILLELAITPEAFAIAEDELLDVWQRRYNAS